MKKIFGYIAICMIMAVFAAHLGLAEDVKMPFDASKIEGPVERVDSSYYYQSAIENASGRSLGEIAKEQSAVGEDEESFGFAEKSEEAKFFLIGSLYSEAIAYVRSGDLKSAAERVKGIEQQFIILRVPRSLYNYTSRMRSILETGKYDAKAAGEMLSLLQPFIEDWARGLSEDKLTLFKTGLFLFDMSLAAAAGGIGLLRQAETLKYYTEEMERMDAPEGVMKSLESITKIVGKESISERDVQEVLKLVKRIQSVLG